MTTSFENPGQGPERDPEDLRQAAADFRVLYYGADADPGPPPAMAELAPEVMDLVDQVVYGEGLQSPRTGLADPQPLHHRRHYGARAQPPAIAPPYPGRPEHRRHQGTDQRDHRPDGLLRRYARGGQRLPGSQRDLRRTRRSPARAAAGPPAHSPARRPAHFRNPGEERQR